MFVNSRTNSSTLLPFSTHLLSKTITGTLHHMMSAWRNSISEIISWMMHKMEKCIYSGIATKSCCCKHRNGKNMKVTATTAHYESRKAFSDCRLMRSKGDGGWWENPSSGGNSSIFSIMWDEFVLTSSWSVAKTGFACAWGCLPNSMHAWVPSPSSGPQG